ncbi:NRDE family protein [Polaromonas sp. YR568]|uniref:NRDE family protein n=1 Tax=Polaromonas sp. YR568 TaxID=1855301 RepID=UPI0031382B45
MCLIAFAIGASERWPLVIAGNRDEFLDRPTLPLARWRAEGAPEIVSGRDLRAGGTWMGLTPGGRVAFLTNVREAPSADAPPPRSRGALVTRWLGHPGHSDDFAVEVAAEAAEYGGFNLVTGDLHTGQWVWMTNRINDGGALHLQPLRPGVYGLSNAALDTPWPKTLTLRSVLERALADDTTADLECPLWSALASRTRAPREQLPATGVSLHFEEALSSAFVESPEHGYGTRCSTLIVASAGSAGKANTWAIDIKERAHRHGDGFPASTEVTLGFSLPVGR